MKNFITLFVFCAFPALLFAQDNLEPTGGGEFMHKNTGKCLHQVDREEIQARIQANSDSLIQIGRIDTTLTRSVVAFEWPLRKSADLKFNSYYGVSNYVDQDLTLGLKDYNCTERTYEGHHGTDISTWPFPWYLYLNDLVEVIAGEKGVIIGKDDGNEDDHCACEGSWNAVYIKHADGSVAWYGHLKNNSLTSKKVGESVAKGDYLGVVASSGCSTGPHLHFEVYDADLKLIDPYAGFCNDLNVESWWLEQPAYRKSKTNAALTHDLVPIHGCPLTNEAPNFKNEFDPGSSVIFAGYFSDALEGSVAEFRIMDAENVEFKRWTLSVADTYDVSWWYWTYTLPLDAPFGVWEFEIDYGGEIVTHEFNYGVYANIDERSKEVIFFYPNPSNGRFRSNFELTSVAVFDITGRLLETHAYVKNELDLSHLRKGSYVVTFETSDGKKVEHLIVH